MAEDGEWDTMLHPALTRQALNQAAAYLIELETLADRLVAVADLMRKIETLELELKLAKS